MNYLVVGADGKEYGPVDVANLAQWAKDDRVRPTTVLKELDTGRALTANEVPGLFQPLASPSPAAGNWSQAPNYYPPPHAPAVGYEGGKSAFLWAFIDSGVALALFFGIGGIGLFFGTFGVVNAFKAKSAGHPNAIVAIVVSVIALAIVLVGWLVRLSSNAA
jgi:hypothetical protein